MRLVSQGFFRSLSRAVEDKITARAGKSLKLWIGQPNPQDKNQQAAKQAGHLFFALAEVMSHESVRAGSDFTKLAQASVHTELLSRIISDKSKQMLIHYVLHINLMRKARPRRP